MSASRTRNRVVILHALTLRPQSPVVLSDRILKTIYAAWSAALRACTPSRLITCICVLCAISAIFAGMHTAATGSDNSRIILAVITLIGLPLSIIGAFISSAGKGGEA